VNDQERKSLWEDTRDQNSRLQQLIDGIIQLVARSRDVLRRQRPEDGAPAREGTPDRGS
jgi:hypothetical protein